MSTSPSASSFDTEDAMLEQFRSTRGPKRKSTPLCTGDLLGRHRHAMIAEAAYYCAERRGFAPGQELEDWLRAEARIDASLR